MDRRRHDRCRRICAHATGIRTEVAVEQALVILARRQRQRMLAVTHHDEARFLALEKVLDHDSSTTGAERIGDEHRVDRRFRLSDGCGNDDTLAGGQPVGFDDHRRAMLANVCARFRGVGEGAVFRRRDTVSAHERLGEVLRALELRGGARRAEHAQSASAEHVDDSARQRCLRADDGQSDAFRLYEVGQRLMPVVRDILQVPVDRRAAVAGRDIDALHAR